MSPGEGEGARPAPLIPDASVLTAIARGDAEVMSLVQGYDAAGHPLVVSAMAATAASLDMPPAEAAALLRGLERMRNALTAPVLDSGQGVRLATVINRTGLDPWDAHVAAVADASVGAILTLDAAKWQRHAHDLDEQLHFVEIADPDDEGQR